MKLNIFWKKNLPWCIELVLLLENGTVSRRSTVHFDCASHLHVKKPEQTHTFLQKMGGKFCAGGFCLLPHYRISTWNKKNFQIYNKAYLKVRGVLLHVLFMLHFCFADTRSPFSWGEDKEGIPPNVTKTGPTLVNVNLSCSQSFSDP